MRCIECDAHKVVFSLGNTSFTIAADFRVAGEERIIVTADTVYVLVDAKTLTKMPLPAHVRAALQEGAAGRMTDHAACLAAAGR